MNTKRQCCGTCNMGQFEKTASGRRRNAAGKCLYEIPIPTLPNSVILERRVNPFLKNAVWPADGDDCPLWAPRKP